MARVLLTGMSGAGKSTVVGELRRRGHAAVDTDYDSWTLPDGTWDEPRMERLLDDHETIVVSGTVENQGRFYRWFDDVVLLSAPLEVLLTRLRTRNHNPYGKTAEQAAEVARYVETVEPLLRRGATVELDGQRPLPDLVDAVERLLTTPSSRRETSARGEHHSSSRRRVR